VLLEQMPVTANGKIDRQALPALELAERDRPGAYVPPRTPIEEVLAGIWANLIGCAQVGIYDNFFELGGHSLLATQIATRMRDTFQVEVPLRRLFEKPTVAELAELIEELRRTEPGLQLPPITPLPRDGDPPLSFAQQRLWFLDQLQPDNPSYNVPAAVRLSGRLDISALRRSLALVVARHEALRTTFRLIDGQPVQHIAPALTLALPLVDLQLLSEAVAAATTRTLATAEARSPFDLAHGPLLRTTLLRLRPDQHVLLLTMHHIVSDGWSMGVLVRELTSAYLAYVRGQPATLPALPIQYSDYAAWQRQWLHGEGDHTGAEGDHTGSPLQYGQGDHTGAEGDHTGSPLQTQLAYWTAQLQGAPALLNLPADFPRSARRSFRGARQTFALAPELVAQLHRLSQRAGATLFMTLLAGFALLLARYSGQDDSVIGTPIAGRTRAETERLIGFFVNTLALRIDLAGNPPFVELLARVRAVALDAYAHQDLPFERLVEALQPSRSLSHNPLFQAMFSFGTTPLPSAEGSELTAEGLDVHSGTTKFDLTLNLDSARPDLAGWLEYSTELFEDATITRMLAQFQTLLAGIAAAPDQPLAALPLATPAEQQALVALGMAPAPLTRACIHSLFAEQAARTPDAVALAAPDGQLSYGALDARANQLAHILQTCGIGPETIVGVFLERTLDLVVALLGILKAGGAYLPLDRTAPLERRAFVLQDARAALLITRCSLQDECPAELTPVLLLDELTAPPMPEDKETGRHGDKEIAQLPVSLSPGLGAVGPTNPAYLIYTSGSTGQPKGVLVTHYGLGNMVAAQIRAFGVRPGSRVLQFASVSFDASISEMFMALLAGATLHLEQRDALLPGPALLEYLDRHMITTVTLSPSILAALPNTALPTLHTIIAAGEDCPAEQVARWSAGRRFFNAYGPTETTVCATIAECGAGRHPAIGRPLPNVEVYVLDQLLRPAPIGVPGELFIGGAGLARGYFARPDLTAERFVPNPFADFGFWILDFGLNPIQNPKSKIQNGTRLYKTGDRARWLASGELEYLGRLDQQIKLRGYRVELGEIAAVLRSHPGVQDAVAAVWEEPPGDARLVAYVVPQDADKETRRHGDTETEAPAELRGWLTARLPAYMVPAQIVWLDALPLTSGGKLDRRALPAADDRPTLEQAYVAPRSALEEILATLWAEVLGVARVGIHDNFFELGGHSLLVTQLISRIRATFAVDLPVQELFTANTVARLAEAMQSYEPEPGQSERVAWALKKVLSMSNSELLASLQEKRGAQ